MTVERYENGEPVPDGYHYITFRVDPFSQAAQETLAPQDGRLIKLKFKDYEYFKYEPCECGGSPIMFVGKHREGHFERYMLHNILYLESHHNSVEVSEAIRKWREEQDDEL